MISLSLDNQLQSLKMCFVTKREAFLLKPEALMAKRGQTAYILRGIFI